MANENLNDQYDDDYDDLDDQNRGSRRADVAAAKSKVMIPSILLIVHAVVAILFLAYGLVKSLISDPMDSFRQQRIEQENDPRLTEAQKQQTKEMYDAIEPWLETYVKFTPLITGVAFLAQLVVLVGGIKLMNLSSSGLATFGSLIAIVPCCLGGCYAIGIPAGIWALLAMRSDVVKAAFAAKRG